MQTLNSTDVVIDAPLVRQAMSRRGFTTVQQLADAIGVHRNTVNAYLAGERALPDALERMLEVLNLSPAEVLKQGRARKQVAGLKVRAALEILQSRCPDGAYVLFGSRARGNHKPQSDYDIGIYRRVPFPIAEFSALLTIADEWNEKNLSTIQLVNLSNADRKFLGEIAVDAKFLGGQFAEWAELLSASGVALYE